MAKAHKHSKQSLETFLTEAEKLWNKCQGKFFAAIDEGDTKVLNVDFSCTINLKENAPVIDVAISFKDKTVESGIDVNKTFHMSSRVQGDDPDQPELPGAEKKKGKKGDEEAAAE